MSARSNFLQWCCVGLVLSSVWGYSVYLSTSTTVGQTAVTAPTTIAVTGGTADDTTAIQTAITNLPVGGKLVFTESTTYTLKRPISILAKPCTIDATGADLVWMGADNVVALTIGYAPSDPAASGFQKFKYTVRGLRFRNTLPRTTNNVTALRWQNIYVGVVDDLSILGFGTGFELIGDGTGCTYGRYTFREFLDNRLQLHAIAKNGGYVTESNLFGPGHFGFNKPFAGLACCHLRTETDGTANAVVGGLRSWGLCFEGQDSNCVAGDIKTGRFISWVNCRFETSAGNKLPINLAATTSYCTLLGTTTNMVSWQNAAPLANLNQYLPNWK